MSLILANRVKETSTTAGSGTISLSGADSGYQSFSSVLSSGDTTYYTLVNSPNWEVGIGTYGVSTLSRDTVLSSSNSGNKITLSGTSQVFIAYPSEKSVYKDLSDLSVVGSGVKFADSSVQTTAFTSEIVQDMISSFLSAGSGIQLSYNDLSNDLKISVPAGGITNELIGSGISASKISGIIDSSNLPSYVDDVLEYADFSSLPPTGESGKIYLTIDNNRSYRWSGTQYVQITDTTALWGSITGTLGSQTDLINYVVPQSRNVNAGTALSGGGSLSGDITLSLTNTAVSTGVYGSPTGVGNFTVDQQGRLTSASEIPISGLIPPGGTAGQILIKDTLTDYDVSWVDNYATQVHQYVKNSTGTTLNKGQVVYINGADGTNPTIALAVASGEAGSSKTLGFLNQSLAQGEFGYVVTEGEISGIDTSGANTDGDAVWLSPTTPGGVVYGLANKPYAPNHMVFLGYVVRKNANNGRIYVKVQNGFELDELHNVLAKNPTDGDIIRYVGSSGLWVSGPMPVSYTNEDAQDAVGGILTNTSTINLSYSDNTPSISATIPSGAITESLLATGINVSKFTNDVGYLTTHPPVSAAPSSDNSGRTYIQDIILDSNGHVTGITTATETVVDTNTTYSAGTGLSLDGTTFNLANTAVSSGVYGSENQVGQFTVDSQGRITNAANVTIRPRITSGTTNPAGGENGDIYFQHQDATDIVDFVPTNRTLTINGVSYDLSANRSWTISTTGLANLNGLTIGTQTLQSGTTGTDFNIVSSGSIHTFNLPDASATARGLVTTGAQTFNGEKTFTMPTRFNNTIVASGYGFLTTAGGTMVFDNHEISTVSIRQGASPLKWEWSNVWTSYTSFETGRIHWQSNEWRIGTAVGSAGGSSRGLAIGAWNTTGSFLRNITVNSGGSLDITGALPAQTTTATAGNNLTLKGSDAVAGTTSVTAASGGSVTILAGNAATNGSGSPFPIAVGGSVTIGAGSGAVTGSTASSGGNVTIYAGNPGSGSAGSVNIVGAGTLGLATVAYSFNGGPVNIFTPNNTGGAGNYVAGAINIYTGHGSDTSSTPAASGAAINVTSARGNRSTGAGGTSGNGGTISIASGAGGAATGTSGVMTGGVGGPINLTAGAGGAATSSGGTRVGGAGGSLSFSSGDGGQGSTTNGIGGNLTLTAGLCGSGAGSTAENGSILLVQGATTRILINDSGVSLCTTAAQKLGFFGVTPVVQPTTSGSAATLAGGGGAAITDTDTFDGYTISQLVKALRNLGILA